VKSVVAAKVVSVAKARKVYSREVCMGGGGPSPSIRKSLVSSIWMKRSWTEVVD
jgi:hypothetical protein